MGEGLIVSGECYAKRAGAEAWTALLFASALFGYLVLLLGSWLDGFYPKVEFNSKRRSQ